MLIVIVMIAVHPSSSFSSSSDDDDRCDCYYDWTVRISIVAVVVADIDSDDTFFSFSSFLRLCSRLWLVSACHPYC